MSRVFMEFKCPELVSLTKDAYYLSLTYMSNHYRNSHVFFKTFPILGNEQNLGPFSLIKNKYPFLGNSMAIFEIGSESKFKTPHIDQSYPGDPFRHYSINIPIENCTSAVKTEIFKRNEEDFGPIGTNLKTVLGLLPGRPMPDKIAEYILTDNPIMLDTHQPHMIVPTNNTATRISVSWTVADGWDFNSVEKVISNNKQ
jgi:hypothetical protein